MAKPDKPGHGGNGHGFEKKVLDSLQNIERGLMVLAERIQAVDNKLDLLILKVEECCEPAPRPEGVQIDQRE